MYFVDQKQIHMKLKYMEKLLFLIEKDRNWINDTIASLAYERMTHTVIEAMIDVGNAMIDGFIMRDPGSYEDVIDIMEDERVITTEMSIPLKRVINLRKMIVQDYIQVDLLQVIQVMNDAKDALKQFPSSVRTYLENELGPVSAFSPEE